MINSSRQSNQNSEANYGYGMNNYDTNGGSNFYSGVIPNFNGSTIVGSNMGGGLAPSQYGQYVQYGYMNDKAYSVVNIEPTTVKKDQPIILVDPIMETHVKSYLTWSLCNIFFCCFFGGIVTTFMSCNVMRLNDNKNFKEALRLSGKVLIANMAISALGAFIFLVVFPYIYMAIYPSLPKINW